MDKNIYIVKDENLAFELNENKKLIYFYHLDTSNKIDEKKYILKTINSKLAQDICEYFEIDVREYGITIDDSPKREFTKEEKDKIYEERGLKYFFGAIFIILIVLLALDKGPRGPVSLAYVSIFLLGFLFIFIAGKEQYEKEKVDRRIKYNITTVPLPTQNEQIEILEAKIDSLLEEKKVKR